MKFRFNPINTLAAILGFHPSSPSISDPPRADAGFGELKYIRPMSRRERIADRKALRSRPLPKAKMFPKHTPPGAVGQQPDRLFPGIRQRRADQRAALLMAASFEA